MKELFTLIIYSVTVYAISNMFVYANGPFGIFDKIRQIASRIGKQFEELFSCMICFPTWVGIFMSLINLIFFPECGLTPFNCILPHEEWMWIIIFDAAYASGITWLIHTCQEAIERTNNYE